MVTLRAKTFLVACCGAMLLAAVAGGSASAQTLGLPGVSFSPDPNDPVQQLMLSGEAAAVSQFLGISEDQLRQELVGHSLADVTQQHGKSVRDMTALVVRTADNQLDAAVAGGQISSETASNYEVQIGLFAPFLVSSQQASAMALQAADAAAPLEG